MSAAIEMAPGVFGFPPWATTSTRSAFVEDDGSVTLVDCGGKEGPAEDRRGAQGDRQGSR